MFQCTRTKFDHAKIIAGVDLISDALPFGRLWYTKPDDAIGYAKFRDHSHDALIRVYDEVANVIETHEQNGGNGELGAPTSVRFNARLATFI